MPAILTVVHQESSSPGLVGQVLQSWGYRLDQRCPALGEPLPEDLSFYSGVIVFGGPMSANDDDTLPFIADELHWLERVLAAQVPYLGICLGAQLLARTLGATVAPRADELREIGYFPLTPTAAGTALFPRSLHVYHWHGEGFDIPAGGVHLAQGTAFVNQAFCYDARAYGLQFHPEITTELIHAWTERAGEQLQLPGAQSKAVHLYQHQLHGVRVQMWLQRFLRGWLATAHAGLMAAG